MRRVRLRTPVDLIRAAPVTWSLCVAIGALALARRASERRSGELLVRFGALPLPLLDRSGLWRALTYGFVHAGATHLLINLSALVVFGRLAERQLGSARALTAYALSGVVGSAAVAAGAFGPVLLVGASASILGLVGATFATELLRVERASSRISRAEFAAAAGVVLAQVCAGVISPSAAAAAHLGGLLAGTCYGAALAWSPTSRNREARVAVVPSRPS